MNSRTRRNALIPIVALALAACGGGGGGALPPAAMGPPPAAPVAPAALLYYDNGGGIQDSLRMTVRDAAQFQDFWRRATSTQPSPPPMPTVDFERSMVLIVSAGRMTPEDMLRVDSVGVYQEARETGGTQRVMQAIVRTIRGCGGFNSDAYPVAIVRVERFDGPIRFTERRERAEGCPGALSDDRYLPTLAATGPPAAPCDRAGTVGGPGRRRWDGTCAGRSRFRDRRCWPSRAVPPG